MNCPDCGKQSDVIDTRPVPGFIRRRRECLNYHRFTTVEMVGTPDALRGLLKAAAAIQVCAGRVGKDFSLQGSPTHD